MNRLTILQFLALRYAAGKHPEQPSGAVARRLESRGLLVWAGPLRGLRDLHPTNPDAIVWRLTEAGQAALTQAEESGRFNTEQS